MPKLEWDVWNWSLLDVPTSVPDLTNALVGSTEIPTAALQHLIESLLERVELVISGARSGGTEVRLEM